MDYTPTLTRLTGKWVREWHTPPPPRCSDRVNSLYLPACVLHAPGYPNLRRYPRRWLRIWTE